MRYKLTFELENETIPIQYRKNILSFIKLSLENYNKDYYNKYYHAKDPIMKPYTFSVYLKDAKFNAETVTVQSKELILNFSTADTEAAVILYNSFNNQLYNKISMNKNSMTLVNISMLPEKEITSNKIQIKFMSPLVARLRDRENKKDFYYSFNKPEFLDALKINIKAELKHTNLPDTVVDTFEIQPIMAKKSVIKFYEKKIEVSLGTFEISGEIELLNYLYKAGIGAKHSAGFGMFEVIN